MQFPFITYGMALQTTVYWQNTNIEEICVYASERRDRALTIFVFSHSKTAISFNIFWCFSYFVSETYIFFRSQITSAYKQTMQLPFITYGVAL